MRKFTRAESTQVLSPEAHKAVEDELTRLGKTSARDLTDDERESLQDSIDSSDNR